MTRARSSDPAAVPVTLNAVLLSGDRPHRLVVHGDFSLRTAPTVRRLFDQLLNAGPPQVSIDVRGVSHFDSTGLGTLVALRRRARARDIDVWLLGPSPRIRKMLARTGLETVLNMRDATPPDPAAHGVPAGEVRESLHLDLPCDTRSLAFTRAHLIPVLARLGVGDGVRDDLLLGTGEAIANSIRHGCPSGAPGTGIRLDAWFTDRCAWIEVIDSGPGFDPDSVPVPDVTRLGDGGMGVYLMKQVMDSVTFANNDRGHVVAMVRALP